MTTTEILDAMFPVTDKLVISAGQETILVTSVTGSGESKSIILGLSGACQLAAQLIPFIRGHRETQRNEGLEG